MKGFGTIRTFVIQWRERLLDLLLPPGDDMLIVRTIRSKGLVPTMRIRVVNAEDAEHCASTPRIIALLPYPHRAVKACVRQAKFHANDRATRLLGEALATFLRDRIDPRSGSIVLVPIPLSKNRLALRGYNQAERIVDSALGSISTEAGFVQQRALLKRVRDTLPQTTLANEARAANLVGAFSCIGTIDPRLAYMLIDDVSTTGATFLAAASALHAAGAKRLICVALAH